MTKTIYKICTRDAWARAVQSGVYYGAPIDLEDGFIHFSSATQVAETAAKHFNGQSDLVLVALDTGKLGSGLKWEPSRGGDLFPHLYGQLRADLAEWVKPLPLGTDGQHVFPEGVLA